MMAIIIGLATKGLYWIFIIERIICISKSELLNTRATKRQVLHKTINVSFEQMKTLL